MIENKKKKKMKSNQCHAPFTERLPKYLQPTYGWAMSFGKGYAKQSDIVRTSCYYSTDSAPPYFYSDGIVNGEIPPYQLRTFSELSNCPYYNYTLPDTYPYVESPSIQKDCYWYLPYDTFDSTLYQRPFTMIPKP